MRIKSSDDKDGSGSGSGGGGGGGGSGSGGSGGGGGGGGGSGGGSGGGAGDGHSSAAAKAMSAVAKDKMTCDPGTRYFPLADSLEPKEKIDLFVKLVASMDSVRGQWIHDMLIHHGCGAALTVLGCSALCAPVGYGRSGVQAWRRGPSIWPSGAHSAAQAGTHHCATHQLDPTRHSVQAAGVPLS